MPRPRQPPRLHRRPGKRFWYVIDGPHRYSTETEDRQEAERWLADYVSGLSKPPPDPTILDLFNWRRRLADAAGQARARSVMQGYHKMLEEHFGALRPEQVTPELVARYVKHRQSIGRQGRHELIELRSTLNAAAKAELITKAPSIKIPAGGRPRDVFLTRDEFRRLLTVEMPRHTWLFILIAGSTGARKGAILDLTWDRVHFARGVVDFNHPDKAPNNKRRAVVPLSTSVMDVLRAAHTEAKGETVIEVDGNPVQDVKNSFRHAVTQIGRPEVTPHAMKHSVISWLAQEGVPIDRIAYLTETSRKTVERVYRKYNPEHFAAEVAILGNGLEDIGTMVPKQPSERAAQKRRNPPVSRGVSMVEPRRIELLTSTLPV